MGGAEVSHCYSAFAYRDAAALQALAELYADLSACFGARRAQETGALVNHPDSFEQAQFCMNSGSLSLSLKDKAAFQETLIFVRSTHAKLDPDQCGPVE